MRHINLNELKRQVLTARQEKYHQYLESYEWQALRQRVLERDYYCRACGCNLSTEVHHLTYARIYHERPEDLVGLCYYCHREVHEGSSQKHEGSSQEK